MNIPEKPTKAVVSVVEMAEILALSRSRFYALIQSGIFPEPIRNESCKSLGLQTTAEVVDGALRELFPSGWADVDEGQRVRQVFLHLQKKK